VREGAAASGPVHPGDGPRVSVIVPCRNAERWIADAVGSAIGQAGVSLEVVVVDDGSTDRSAAVAEGLGDARVTVIRQAPHGVSRARTAGTRIAAGEYVQYLDADDILCPGTLRARVAALERTDADVAYCDWVPDELMPAGGFRPGTRVSRTLGPRPELDLLTEAWWPPGALLYRRRIVDAIGPWREDLPVIQDARFLLDAALHGARFVHVAEVGLRYRVHGADSLSRRDPRAFLADCLRNALDVEVRWVREDRLDPGRRAALRQVYGYVSRAAAGLDRRLFEQAVSALLRIDPGFRPTGSGLLRAAAGILGYRRAERAAGIWRRWVRSPARS
jgi:glycosyltransferase involved in cell wall biosynthesis